MKKINLEHRTLQFFFVLWPIALSFETNALEAFTQFNVNTVCHSNRAKIPQIQLFMQHYRKENPSAKSSVAQKLT